MSKKKLNSNRENELGKDWMFCPYCGKKGKLTLLLFGFLLSYTVEND